MTQNPSLTGEEYVLSVAKKAPVTVHAAHYGPNECPHFGHYPYEKMQKVSDSAGRCGGKIQTE